MKRTILFSLITTLALASCVSEKREQQIDQWKQEVRETEWAFSRLSEKEGIATAFLTYAAEDAVLMRNNSLVKGYDAIKVRFEANPADPTEVTLTWNPDFVEVSNSGDLAYTYGTYTLVSRDSLGAETTNTGIFHTVWKRQKDGSWKFVWD